MTQEQLDIYLALYIQIEKIDINSKIDLPESIKQ